jgi:hypothetical protein
MNLKKIAPDRQMDNFLNTEPGKISGTFDMEDLEVQLYNPSHTRGQFFKAMLPKKLSLT